MLNPENLYKFIVQNVMMIFNVLKFSILIATPRTKAFITRMTCTNFSKKATKRAHHKMAKVDAVMSEIHELVSANNLGCCRIRRCRREIVSYSEISKGRIYERI
jgi:hypothetical protein